MVKLALWTYFPVMKAPALYRAHFTLESIIQCMSVSQPVSTVKTLKIGTPRPTTVDVLNLKQFDFTMQ